jgi:hypothetical protein
MNANRPGNKMYLAPFRISFLGIAILSALGNLIAPFVLNQFGIYSVGNWNFQTIWVGALNGLLIGEFVAVAFWMLYDPLSLSKKLLLGTFVGLLLAACLILGMKVWPGMPLSAGVFVLIVGSMFPILFVCFLYGARRITMMKDGAMFASKPEGKSRQYGIGFLFVVMVVVALTLTLIRSVLPSGGDDWLSAWEFVFLGLWFVWLSISVTLFIWFPFLSVMHTTWFNVSVSLVLAVLGPSLFDWISSFILIGRWNAGYAVKMFDALPQCMSFGLFATSLLMGAIIRLCAQKEPALVGVPASAGVNQI